MFSFELNNEELSYNLDRSENTNLHLFEVFKGKKYTYYVRDIWEEKKNGYINISEEDTKQLILTTCSPNRYGYQLIINCIEKESN
jgi:sortase (surface protein transpeptidase)